MKKLALTLAIVLGLSMTTFAEGGGLFQRGAETEESNGFMSRGGKPGLPGEHGLGGDQDSNTPLGGGALLLVGLGAAYAMTKKRKD